MIGEVVLAPAHRGDGQPGHRRVVAGEVAGHRVEVDRGAVRRAHPAHHGQAADEPQLGGSRASSSTSRWVEPSRRPDSRTWVTAWRPDDAPRLDDLAAPGGVGGQAQGAHQGVGHPPRVVVVGGQALELGQPAHRGLAHPGAGGLLAVGQAAGSPQGGGGGHVAPGRQVAGRRDVGPAQGGRPLVDPHQLVGAQPGGQRVEPDGQGQPAVVGPTSGRLPEQVRHQGPMGARPDQAALDEAPDELVGGPHAAPDAGRHPPGRHRLVRVAHGGQRDLEPDGRPHVAGGRGGPAPGWAGPTRSARRASTGAGGPDGRAIPTRRRAARPGRRR